ncbi:hypothetical protein LSH36_202g06006 [Paralvinella palmiformis]|uniref:Ig-like domain-containing protein n=1 Tax=Paralvinella palmiformis TaxID=53620 RepID=A0AAD9JPK1_9ANNE|nr:hypothetical protein LSH36_202g06006 [Paralvinella palmiformis]
MAYFTSSIAFSVAPGVQLIIKPQNTVASSGQSSVLFGKTDSARDIYWSKCSAQGNCTRISKGGTIVVTDPGGKYSIERPSAGEFNLVINPLDRDDGLQYQCKVQDILSSETAYGELIVLRKFNYTIFFLFYLSSYSLCDGITVVVVVAAAALASVAVAGDGGGRYDNRKCLH